MGEILLVVGACDSLLADALARAGADGGVVVVDPSGARLQELQERVADPRVWFLVGDGDVVPLPDRSVDSVLGPVSASERERVCR